MPTKINGVEISDNTLSYLETALWSSTISLPVSEDELDEDGCMKVNEHHPLYQISKNDQFNEHFNLSDFHPEILIKAEKDVSEWFSMLKRSNLYDLATDYQDDGRIAHDLWLTCNGHGAGYWDGDYGKNLGETLTRLAEELGELDILVDENGVLFFE